MRLQVDSLVAFHTLDETVAVADSLLALRAWTFLLPSDKNNAVLNVRELIPCSRIAAWMKHVAVVACSHSQREPNLYPLLMAPEIS